MVEQSAATARPFGVDPATTDWRSELFISGAEREHAERCWRGAGDAGPKLLVNLSSAQRRNRWPDERFAAAIRHASRARAAARIVVIGSPAEKAQVRAVAEAAGARAEPDATLRQALALVATADAVLTPDTSIAHMAAALRIPSVVMILRRVRQFVPYRGTGEVLFAPGDSLESLSEEPVLAALDRVLGGA
jgi:ADP-heptose:LPS heptosyltransferase